METTLLSEERKNKLQRGNDDLLKAALLVILILFARLLFAEGLAVTYSSTDVKALKKWDTNCDLYNYVNWNTEADPARFVGITWDSSNPKRVIKVILESYNFYNSVDLNELPMLNEVNFSSCRLSAVSVANHAKIQNLIVAGNRLTSLDVTGCIALKKLQCQANSLTSLTLGNAAALKDIYCHINQLTEIIFPAGASVQNLDISQNKLPMSKMPIPSASYTSYQYADQLPVFTSSTQWLGYTIDYSSEATFGGKATSFSWFKNKTQIFGASGATYKPVSAGVYSCHMTNVKFPWLTIETEPITIRVDPDDTNGDGYHDGDVATLNQLRSLYSHIASSWPEGQHATWSGITWDNNPIKRVQMLNLSSKNLIGNVDISAFSNLEQFYATSNFNTGLNVTGLTKLKLLDVKNCRLQSLNITGLSGLEELHCENNLIEELQYGNNTKLKFLYIMNNQIENFNAASFPALRTIDCKTNELALLDFSSNPDIAIVDCSHNALTSLLINPSILQLLCNNNRLSTLSLANCIYLEMLDISANKFTEIDLSGAPNIFSFKARWNYMKFSKLPDPSLFWECEYIDQIQVTPNADEKIGYVIDLSTETIVLGTPTVFVWKKNDEIIPDATGATLNTSAYGIGNYSCKMTNAAFPFVEATTGTYSISKKDQVISGTTAYHLTYEPVTIHLDVVSSSGLPLTFTSTRESVSTVQGDSITITGAGFCNIRASQEGNDEYNPISINISVDVMKGEEPILGLSDVAAVYGDGPLTINARTLHDLPVTLSTNYTDIVRIEGNLIHIIGVGNAVIYADHDGNDNYNRKSGSFYVRIVKGEAPIFGVDDMTFTYGDAPVEIQPYTSQGFPVIIRSMLPSSFSIAGTTLTINGAGSGQMSFTHLGNDNYNAQMIIINVTVNKATQTGYSFANLERSLGDPAIQLPAISEQGFTFSYTSSNTSVATVSGNEISIVGQGECTIQASNQGNYNYDPIDESFTLNVSNQTKQIQTISNFDNMEVTATTPFFNFEALASSRLPITYSASNNCAEITGNKATIKNSGLVEITAHQAGNETYYPVEKTIMVEIKKVSQTISGLINLFKSTNSAPFILNGTASSGLGISYTSSNPAIATVSGNMVTIHAEGETTISATQEGNWQFLPVSTEIRLTVSAVNKLVDEITSPESFDLLFGVQSMRINVSSESGLPITISSSNEHVISVEDDLLKVNNAGIATVYLSTQGNDLYAPAEKSFVVTVKKAKQFINHFNPLTLKIDLETVALMAEASSGEMVKYLAEDESIASISGIIITPVSTGTTLLIAYHEGNENFLPVSDTVEVVVLANKLTQSVDLFDIEATYGDEPVELPLKTSAGLNITYSTDDTKVATVANNVLVILGTGETFVNATQSGNDLFEPFSWKVKLTVNKAPQTISGLNDITIDLEKNGFDLKGMATSGLAVVYESADLKTATIEGDNIILHKAGEVVITAIQPGNANYHAADKVTFKIVITSTVGTNQAIRNNLRVYPNPSIGIINIDLPVSGKIEVVDLNGQIVFKEDFNGDFNHQINLQQLRKGCYQLIVKQSEKRYSSRIILK